MYEREVKDYCRRAGGLLACGRTQRREFDRLTAQSVRDYLQEAPDASWTEVEQILGSPQDAADAFMESMPPDTAERWAGARKRRLRLAAVSICLVIALLVGVIAYFWVTQGVVLIETETTVTYYDSSVVPQATARPFE